MSGSAFPTTNASLPGNVVTPIAGNTESSGSSVSQVPLSFVRWAAELEPDDVPGDVDAPLLADVVPDGLVEWFADDRGGTVTVTT
jgi:hypothetical protein